MDYFGQSRINIFRFIRFKNFPNGAFLPAWPFQAGNLFYPLILRYVFGFAFNTSKFS